MHQFQIHRVQGKQIWQTVEDLPPSLRNALEHRYEASRNIVAIALLALGILLSVICAVIYVQSEHSYNYRFFEVGAILLPFAGLAAAIQYRKLLQRHERTLDRLAKGRDRWDGMLLEDNPIFRAIMTPHLVEWLESRDPKVSLAAALEFESYLLEAEYEECALERALAYTLSADASAIAELEYQYDLKLIDTASDFYPEIARALPLHAPPYDAEKLRKEALSRRGWKLAVHNLRAYTPRQSAAM